MSIWFLLGFVFAAGGVGGLVNGLILFQGQNQDSGLLLPRIIPKGDGSFVLCPGFLGNILIGGVAASVFWLVYGPLSQFPIDSPLKASMLLTSLGGAVLVGMAGASWLSNMAGKTLYQIAASQAAGASASTEVANQILTASPRQALDLTRNMQSAQMPTKE